MKRNVEEEEEPKGLSLRDSTAARNGPIGPINPPNDQTLKVSPLELKVNCSANTLGLSLPIFLIQANIRYRFHTTKKEVQTKVLIEYLAQLKFQQIVIHIYQYKLERDNSNCIVLRGWQIRTDSKSDQNFEKLDAEIRIYILD